MSVKETKTAVVFPGSVLCTEEEFAPGINTTVDSNGSVVSVTTGTPRFDSVKREATVVPGFRSFQLLQPKSTVIGRVVLVKDNAAIIEPIVAERNGVPQAFAALTMAIPVSRIDRGFIRSAKDCFKVGDVIVGLVERVMPWGVDLTTDGLDWGVLCAFCSRCKNPLTLSGRQLVCPVCKNTEIRKISSQYSQK